MSIPAILGALVLDLPEVIQAGSIGVGWAEMAAGFIASAVSGYLAIKWLLRIVTSEALRALRGIRCVWACFCLLAGLFGAGALRPGHAPCLSGINA